MSRNQAFRLPGEVELQALQRRIGYRGGEVTPSAQAQYGRRGEMIDTEIPALLERDIQGPVLQTLWFHPKVAFAWRSNSGKFKLEGERWMVVNFKGCSDILGMLKEPAGRFLAVECKKVGEKPTPEQQSFLDQVNESGGLGICVHSVAELHEKLR